MRDTGTLVRHLRRELHTFPRLGGNKGIEEDKRGLLLAFFFYPIRTKTLRGPMKRPPQCIMGLFLLLAKKVGQNTFDIINTRVG
jgi:hypothetical protein